MSSVAECEVVLENILAVLVERAALIKDHISPDCFTADNLRDRNLHGHRAQNADYTGILYSHLDTNSLSA